MKISKNLPRVIVLARWKRLLFVLALVIVNVNFCNAQSGKTVQPYLTGIFAKKADTLQQWYTSNLGFKIKDSGKLVQRNITFYLLEKDSFLVEIIQRADVLDLKRIKDTLKEMKYLSGYFKTGFYVNDIKTWYNDLKSKNVKIKSENVTTGKTSLYLLCEDPEGNLVQLFQKENLKNSSTSMDTDAEAIKNAIQHTAKAIRDGNAEGIMATYSKDILVSYPGIPDTHYDAFYESYKQMLKPRPGIISVTVPIIDEIIVSGDLAVVRMMWETTITETATQKTSSRKAKDLQVWQRENGNWKFTRGMWYHMK